MQSLITYKENNDILINESFIKDYHLLVSKIALKLKKRLPSFIELEDLMQAGFIGLFEAKKNFNTEKGASFETYASIRVKGAMLDSLRRGSYGNKESIKYIRIINEAVNKLEQRIKRVPTSEEIASELGISIDKYSEMTQQITIHHVVDIDATTETDYLDTNNENDPSIIIENESAIEQIKIALTKLPEKDRIVLSLYYIDELSLKQIGQVLDLTEARVCQIHSQAILKLKSRLDI